MQQRKFHRVLNFRAFLIITVVIAAAVFCGIFAENNIRLSWLIFIGALVLSAVILILAFVFIQDKHKILTIIICCIAFIAAFINLRIVFETRFDKDIISGNSYQISGVVDDIYSSGSTFNIIIKDTRIGGRDVSGKLRIGVSPDKGNSILYYVKSGDKVSFNSTVYRLELIKNGKIKTSYFKTDQRYSAYPDSESDLSFTPGTANAMESFTLNIESILTGALGEELGSLSYSMLTGDKSGVSEETRDSFSASGLGHLLSVSGLHIGFICLILNFLLSKLKVNKKISFSIIMGFLIFYMFLADFSASVIRAVIMCAVMLMSKLLFKQYDPLSSLCLAMSVILLIFPIYLFDAGFILSAGAVYSIILFSKSILKALKKIKIPRFIASPLSTVISVQFGIFPAMLYFFKEIQVYSILTNLILMPLITVAFVLIFVALILCLISSVFTIVLSVFGIPLIFVSTVSYAISLLPYSIIFFPSTGFIFICYPLYLFFSRFYMPIFKISPVKIVSFLLSATLLLNGLYLIPYKNYDNVIIPIHYGGLFSSIVVYDNKTYVVGDFPPAYILEEYLKMKYVRKIDGILLNDLDENTAKEIVRFERNVKISKIFISDVSDISGLKILAENYISTVFMFGDGDILSSVFEGVFDKNKFLAYSLNAENTDILFSKSLNFQSDIFNEYFNKASIVRTYYYYENLYDKIYLYNYAIGNTYEFSLDYNNIFNFSNGEFYKNLLY